MAERAGNEVGGGKTMLRAFILIRGAVPMVGFTARKNRSGEVEKVEEAE
jgi:hypothetical protein